MTAQDGQRAAIQETEENVTEDAWSDKDSDTEAEWNSDTESELGSPRASGYYSPSERLTKWDPRYEDSEEAVKKIDSYVIECDEDKDCSTCPSCNGALNLRPQATLINYRDHSYILRCDWCHEKIIIKTPQCARCRPGGTALWEKERVRRDLFFLDVEDIMTMC